jgi:hypothetical protein
MFKLQFWKDATERAVKTFAQFILVLGGAEAFNVFELDWQTNLGLALGGVLMSFATSIVSAGITKSDTPSLIKEGETGA